MFEFRKEDFEPMDDRVDRQVLWQVTKQISGQIWDQVYGQVHSKILYQVKSHVAEKLEILFIWKFFGGLTVKQE